MNAIFIHDLRLETRIGVYEWEQHLAQTLRLDVELGLPSDAAFRSDDLRDALDYSAVVKRLQAFAADHPHKLTLAWLLQPRIVDDFPLILRKACRIQHISPSLATFNRVV